MSRIKWLASYPKSGSTWMRCFLRAYQFDAYEPIDLNLVGRISKSDSRRSRFEELAGKDGLDDAHVNRLRKRMQQLIAIELGDFQVVKTHNARVAVDGVPLIENTLTDRAIYIVRNPLDIVDSLADHTGNSIDAAIAAMNDWQYSFGAADRKFVRQYLTTWSNHVTSWTDNPPFPVLVLRYEDLLESPVNNFARALHFLGWPFSRDRLVRAIRFSSFDQLAQAEQVQGFQELSEESRSGKFFRVGKAGLWVKRLSKKQVTAVSVDHKLVMHKLGYSL